MLVDEKTIFNEDDTVGYIEAIFKSSNILKTTYFINDNRLYISFHKGGVYSYSNIDPELYYNFKNAESQGKFFSENIKKYTEKYPYRKEFTLYPDEVKEIKEAFDKNKEEDKIELKEDSNIIFTIKHEEYIRINENGFYWKGNLVKEDTEIYDKFKEWLDFAYSLIDKEE